MVYLAELLVIMTVGLKIVRILAQNVPRTRTQSLRPRRVSRVSFSLQVSDGVVFSNRLGTVLLKHKNHLRTICACLALTSKEESCRDSMPFSF